MADHNVVVYSGTARATLETALGDVKTKMQTFDTGSTIRLIGVADIGPGKYWQGYMIYDG